MAMTEAMRNELGDLVRLSRRIHFVPVALAGAPFIVLIAFLVFPLLETRKMGYPFFHLGCAIAFALSGAGVVAWVAEQRFRRGWAAWLCLLVLTVECVGALALRFTGDFYWAFQRGYFLD
jgi:hypothetical protein